VGDTTNLNFDIIDRVLNGVGAVTLSGTTHTLTTTDGTLSPGQYKVLVFGGTPSGTNTVTVAPNDQAKQYFVVNNSGQSVIISQGSGADVTVADGASSIVYLDGAGAVAAAIELAVATLSGLGVTSTAAELNLLDGVTATTAELNILDGVTATAAELNYNDITTLGTSEAGKAVTTAASGVTTFSGLAKSTSYDDAVIILTGTTPAVDLSAGGEFRLTTTGDTTFTVSNPPADGYTTTKTFRITQGGTAYTLTFWTGIEAIDGAIPAAPALNETKEYTLRVSTVSGTTTYILTETGVVS
jgi:hypothetical protein